MKIKIVIVTALLLASSFSAINAQGLRFGFRIGANPSYYHQNAFNPPRNMTTPMPIIGWVYGGQADYWFDSIWALSIQVLHVAKGEKLTNMPSGGHGTGQLLAGFDFTYNYYELPLEVKFRCINYESLHLYLFGGITVGIMSTDKRGDFLYDVPTDPGYQFITSNVDAGIISGIGLDYVFPLGTTFFVDAGYRVGLVNLSNTVKGSTVNDLRFCTGFVFPLKS